MKKKQKQSIAKVVIEQCLWAWRKVNGLNEPNEKNCSCKEVPAYIASAEPREKRIAELEKENVELKEKENTVHTLDVLHKEAVRKYGEVNEQLTKAKEIIKDLLSLCEGEIDSKLVFTRAEQFLYSEVEK